MFDHASLIALFGLIALAAPVLLLCVLGLSSLADRRLDEGTTSRACQAATVAGLLASLAVLALMLLHGTRHEAIEVGEWVVIPTSLPTPLPGRDRASWWNPWGGQGSHQAGRVGASLLTPAIATPGIRFAAGGAGRAAGPGR
jgi:hypothetical protein